METEKGHPWGVAPADDWRRGEAVDTPPPTSPPAFELAPEDVSSIPLWPVQEIVDCVFFVIGAVLLFWLLLAYVGLPRLQEVLFRR